MLDRLNAPIAKGGRDLARSQAPRSLPSCSWLAHYRRSANPVRAGDEPQSGQKPAAADPSRRPNFADDARRILKKQHDRMIDLASQLVGGDRELENLRNKETNQRISTESAQAAFNDAELTRKRSRR